MLLAYPTREVESSLSYDLKLNLTQDVNLGRVDPPSRPFCLDERAGQPCSFGDHCFYSHRDNLARGALCRDEIRGRPCKLRLRGRECRFRHIVDSLQKRGENEILSASAKHSCLSESNLQFGTQTRVVDGTWSRATSIHATLQTPPRPLHRAPLTSLLSKTSPASVVLQFGKRCPKVQSGLANAAAAVVEPRLQTLKTPSGGPEQEAISSSGISTENANNTGVSETQQRVVGGGCSRERPSTSIVVSNKRSDIRDSESTRNEKRGSSGASIEGRAGLNQRNNPNQTNPEVSRRVEQPEGETPALRKPCRRGPERAYRQYARDHYNLPGKQLAHYFAHEELKAVAWNGTDEEWAEFDLSNPHVRKYCQLRDLYVDHKENFRYVKRHSNTFDLQARADGKADGKHRVIDSNFVQAYAYLLENSRKKGDAFSTPMYTAGFTTNDYLERWRQKVRAMKASGGIKCGPICKYLYDTGILYGFDLRIFNGIDMPRPGKVTARSHRGRSEAAKKGWATRRFKAQSAVKATESVTADENHRRRSEAAKKGWATRRFKDQPAVKGSESATADESHRRRSEASKKGWATRRFKDQSAVKATESVTADENHRRRSEAAKKGWATRRFKAQSAVKATESVTADENHRRRSEAAKKGWATRRFKDQPAVKGSESVTADENHRRRSEAAKKGWVTRRANMAAAHLAAAACTANCDDDGIDDYCAASASPATNAPRCNDGSLDMRFAVNKGFGKYD